MKLYILPTCPYCIRVLQFLNGKDVPDLQIINVPPAHQDRTELKELTGQTFVPSLIDGDHRILDDDDGIIDYLGQKLAV